MELVSQRIAKKEINMRKTIEAGERLAVTLRFLATGNTYSDLPFTCRMHISTIGGIISEVCQALYHCLKSEYLRLPNTKGEFKRIQKLQNAGNFQIALEQQMINTY